MCFKKKGFILLFICICPWYLFGQKVYTIETFLSDVSKNHPVAKQADFRINQSISNVLASKGAFDPVFMQENSQKTLDGKSYFDYRSSELKLKTQYGLSVKTGIENSGGNFPNPEFTPGGLSYAGLELPVLKGLLFDQQRATLRQAEIFKLQTEQEKRQMLNDLFLDASMAYWSWTGAYQSFSVFSQNLLNAKQRFNLLKQAYKNGDRAVADTLEAYTQVQNIELMLNDANMELQTTELEISKYLWSDQGIAYLLPSSNIPDIIQFTQFMRSDDLNSLIESAKANHPELNQYSFKLRSLQVEKKLKAQSLLPELNLKLNLLAKEFYRFGYGTAPYFNNNYKFGIDMKFPLLLREGRGNYQKTIFKIGETNSFVNNKAWEIENKIRQYSAQLSLYETQIKNSFSLVNNYQQLLKNEELRFNQGESSLFLINSRELKLLEGLIKLQQLRVKYLQTFYKQQWGAGLLN